MNESGRFFAVKRLLPTKHCRQQPNHVHFVIYELIAQYGSAIVISPERKEAERPDVQI
jgi:hypothetical protein